MSQNHAEGMIDQFRGYSKAMFASWLFYKPARILFDAGEGVSPAMHNFIYAIERVCISHGHYDHVGGLTGLILSRSNAMGDREKPLVIHHPRGDAQIAALRRYIESIAPRRMSYDLIWEPVEADSTIPLSTGRTPTFLQTFPMRHGYNMSVGYRMVERRHRLKEAYRNLPGPEIAKIGREKGREALHEYYDHIHLAYCGDGMAVNPDEVRGAELLIHEATFLAADDRKTESHALLAETLEAARAAEVKCLLLFHLSGRYTTRDFEEAMAAELKGKQTPFPIYALPPRHPRRIRLMHSGA